MKRIVVLVFVLSCVIIKTLHAQSDSVKMVFISQENDKPIMWNRIIILKDNTPSKDTIASFEGNYTYKFENEEINTTKFIFGLESGAFVVEKRLSELIKNPIVLHKYAKLTFDTATNSLYNLKLIEQYNKYIRIIENWNCQVERIKDNPQSH